MAIAREFFGPGWTGEQYDQLIEHMDMGGRAGPGVLFHWAATTPDGIHAVDVYESLEAADQLAQTLVGPAAAALGLPAPEIKQYDVRNHLVP